MMFSIKKGATCKVCAFPGRGLLMARSVAGHNGHLGHERSHKMRPNANIHPSLPVQIHALVLRKHARYSSVVILNNMS